MPRYYFHLVRDDERILDDEGIELQPEDVQPDVLLCVVQSLRGSEDPSEVEDWRGWSVEIADAGGRVVQIMLL